MSIINISMNRFFTEICELAKKLCYYMSFKKFISSLYHNLLAYITTSCEM